LSDPRLDIGYINNARARSTQEKMLYASMLDSKKEIPRNTLSGARQAFGGCMLSGYSCLTLHRWTKACGQKVVETALATDLEHWPSYFCFALLVGGFVCPAVLLLLLELPKLVTRHEMAKPAFQCNWLTVGMLPLGAGPPTTYEPCNADR
jgi:hypothetical protein